MGLQAKPGRAPGYERIFAGKSKGWGDSGVASIHPLDGAITYGAVVELSDDELLQLDVFEGHPNTYKR